jgi:hypothetical protein
MKKGCSFLNKNKTRFKLILFLAMLISAILAYSAAQAGSLSLMGVLLGAIILVNVIVILM